MKRRFSKLSIAEQKKVELDYHRMKPDQLESVMALATRHSPGTIRLSSRLVERLKVVAENEGEPEYQAMVRKWVEERLRQEAKPTRKSAKRSVSTKQDSA
ncbi:MAG: hypothetical protein M3R68_04045 [Acidobacteriota bacterium]|nr:hypothetical protein [Acidobacteriota bacterium]